MQTLIEPQMEKSIGLARVPMSRNRVGLIVGAFLGAWHAAWSAIVALGLGQKVIDFILWLHFMSAPIQIQPFSASRAAGLIAFTFAIGYALGGIFAATWNVYRIQRRYSS